jgi:sugar (pentulose or hexulose) kinase
MLPPVVESGTVLGEVLPELQDDLGAVRVIALATAWPPIRSDIQSSVLSH